MEISTGMSFDIPALPLIYFISMGKLKGVGVEDL